MIVIEKIDDNDYVFQSISNDFDDILYTYPETDEQAEELYEKFNEASFGDSVENGDYRYTIVTDSEAWQIAVENDWVDEWHKRYGVPEEVQSKPSDVYTAINQKFQELEDEYDRLDE